VGGWWNDDNLKLPRVFAARLASIPAIVFTTGATTAVFLSRISRCTARIPRRRFEDIRGV